MLSSYRDEYQSIYGSDINIDSVVVPRADIGGPYGCNIVSSYETLQPYLGADSGYLGGSIERVQSDVLGGLGAEVVSREYKPFDTIGLDTVQAYRTASIEMPPTLDEEVQKQQERIELLETQNTELSRRIEQLQTEKEDLEMSSCQQQRLYQDTAKRLSERVTKLEFYLNHLLPELLKDPDDDDNYDTHQNW